VSLPTTLVALLRLMASALNRAWPPVLALAVVTLGLLTQLLIQHGEADRLETAAVAQRLAARLEAKFAGTETALRVLAASSVVETRDWTPWHSQAKLSLAGMLGNNVVVYDERGHQRLNTLLPADAPLPDRVATPQALLLVFSQPAAVLSDLFVGPVTGTHLVALGVPVNRGERVLFGIGVGISAEQIGRVLETGGVPDGWIAAALDRTGTIAARTREAARFVGEKTVEPLRVAAATSRAGTLTGVTKEGLEVLIAFERIDRLGWTVAVASPLAPQRERHVRTLLMWGVPLLLSLGWLALVLRSRARQHALPP
jgi:hypothetical protein